MAFQNQLLQRSKFVAASIADTNTCPSSLFIKALCLLLRSLLLTLVYAILEQNKTQLRIMPSQIQHTLALIKPDAYPKADQIVSLIERSGFVIAAKQSLTLTKERAAIFYEEHKERSFYDDLTSFMSSGPILAMILRKEDAIAAWRLILGPTDSNKARSSAPKSVRALYGTDGSKNAAHGSDSVKSAAREVQFFFPGFEAPTGFKGADAKDYLNRTVCPVLTKGLTEMCKLNPDNAVEWLGRYLLRESGAKVDENQRRVFFVLGGPGSGKGTQCKRLVEKFGFDHFSAGDLLRAEVKSGSEDGQMIADMIKDGKIVPGEITIGLLKKAIEGSQKAGVLIDGFPRQLGQAGSFEKEVSDFEFVLFFDCPEEEMERRLLERGETSGRSDDNQESIRKRFKTFVETSMPVIEYYEAKGKVHRIDATRSVDEIANHVASLF